MTVSENVESPGLANPCITPIPLTINKNSSRHPLSHSVDCLPASLERQNAPFKLLELPLEIRRMIFWQNIIEGLSPSPELVHRSDLRRTWKDAPSPLLSTSRQVREEVKDLLRPCKHFLLRVTTFGAAFDTLSLSCIIAQGLPLSQNKYDGLPGLQIDVWPVCTDDERKVEMLYLYKVLWKLREMLHKVPMIPKLSICFVENRLAGWSEVCQPTRILHNHDKLDRHDDMEIMMDQFADLNNVESVQIELPLTLQSHQKTQQHASLVAQGIEARFAKDQKFTSVFDSVNPDCHDKDYCTNMYRAVEDLLIKSTGFCLIYESSYIAYESMYKAWYQSDGSGYGEYLEDFEQSLTD